MTNLYNPSRDLTAVRPSAGLGLATNFQCGKCSKRGTTIGRKQRLVRGMKTWVCAACAAPKDAP